MKTFVFNLVDTHFTKYFRITHEQAQGIYSNNFKNIKLTHSQTEMSIYKIFHCESGRLSVPTHYPDLKPQQVAHKAQE